MTILLRAPVVQLLKEDRTGWVSGTVHERKKITDHGSRIVDHGYKNFVFPKKENEQVRYSF